MKKLKYSLVLIVVLSLFVQQLFAVPAYPYPVKIEQADGTTLTVILKGDEFHHYYETEDGFLITKGKDGIFNYAQFSPDNRIIDTRVKANNLIYRSIREKSFTATLNRNISFESQNKQMRAEKAIPEKQSVRKKAYPREGSPRSLVILVNFANLSFVTPNPQQAFDALLNENGYRANGGTGSARDYFIDNSMGKFSPQFDVVGPYTLPRNYEFYGRNGADGFDENPVQMVIDACAAAKNNGIDFTTYDTDNDGIVDNIFVYYAGHNEAEHAGANTVWPHRWGIYPKSLYPNDWNYDGDINNITFDGKRIEDYACTSELRGRTGTNMAGIGTFTHEFGHVLGLADMYPTDGNKHHTLSKWSIMDDGVYLNEGRTPPGYNAFERFQLGFLTPTLLNSSKNILLYPLITTNQAILVSPNNSHNLQGENPNPKEYFLLENRQKIGWDAFLPGEGMLIYRINYNQNDWDNNVPNNNPKKLGVEILPADGKNTSTTLAGDPFPGTSNKTSFKFVTRDSVTLAQPITEIAESNDGIISFYYGTLAEKELRYSVNNNGEVLVFLNPDEKENLYVYDTFGRTVQHIEPTSSLLTIKELEKNIIYIIKYGKRRVKILIR